MKLTQSVSLPRSVTSNRLMRGCSLPPPFPPDSRDVIKLYSWLDLSYNFPFYLSVPYSVSSLSCLSSWLFSRRSKVSREAKVRYLSGWILALKSIYDFPVFKCLFWVSPHSVSHCCVLWPSSLLLLLPQCTPVFAPSPAHNISEKFLNQSTIVSNLQHLLSFSFFFSQTHMHARMRAGWMKAMFILSFDSHRFSVTHSLFLSQQ